MLDLSWLPLSLSLCSDLLPLDDLVHNLLFLFNLCIVSFLWFLIVFLNSHSARRDEGKMLPFPFTSLTGPVFFSFLPTCETQFPSCYVLYHLPGLPIFQDIRALRMGYEHTPQLSKTGITQHLICYFDYSNTFLGNIWLLDPSLGCKWFPGTHLSTRGFWIILHKCIILHLPTSKLICEFPAHSHIFMRCSYQIAFYYPVKIT